MVVLFDSIRFFRIRIVLPFDSIRLLFDSIRPLFDFNKVESNKSRVEWGPYSTDVESNALDIRIEKVESNTNETHIRFDSTVEKRYWAAVNILTPCEVNAK